ncbi:MAG: OmpA family protein [Lachnospiraceae bacterium]|nr:OmpA family protein [Lachnospiraceae bacterium]
MSKLHRRKNDEETTYWLSYSDMMAGLLLCFVLIIALTTLHSKIQYDEKQNELLGKEQELSTQIATVSDQKALLSEQQEALIAQQEKLASQESELTQQSKLLGELEKLMDSQQEKLDSIIGVRTDLVKALKEEFDDSDLEVEVDEQTGAITFNSNILFEYNEDSLKDSGKEFLNEFLPRYASVLLGDKYKDYVSEIIIQGHTDKTGTYIYNLDLSQKRAYSVAQYCLDDDSSVLDSTQLENMRSVVSVGGSSYSDPVYKDDGEIDEDASRRVEILFRLKDEEMISEMMEILNSESSASAETTDTAEVTEANSSDNEEKSDEEKAEESKEDNKKSESKDDEVKVENVE